jgi:hypothetical protein
MLSHCETKLNLFVTFSVDLQCQVCSVLSEKRLMFGQTSPICSHVMYFGSYGIFCSCDLLVALNITNFGHWPLFLSFFKHDLSGNGTLPISLVREGWFLCATDEGNRSIFLNIVSEGLKTVDSVESNNHTYYGMPSLETFRLSL